MTWQLVRFLILGVVNTIVGLAVIFAAKAFLNFGDVAANAFGYAVGLTVSFFLNKAWTFGYKGEIVATAIRFLGVFVVAYFFNLSTVLVLIHWAQINAYLAQTLGVPCYTVVFFLLSRYFVFRNNNVEAASGEPH